MNSLVTEKNSRLLIVDDNRAIHDDFRKVLGERHPSSNKFEEAEAALFGEAPAASSRSKSSFQLDSAYQGRDGLGLVKQALAEGKPYAMAFVDVRMPPGWDGVETTSRIWEVDPDLQVVICTAYSDCTWDEMLQKLGHSDRLVILKKPFDHIEVLQLANSLTRKWQLLQESKGKVADLEKMVVARTAQMVQEQEKFRSIFENSPEGIFQIAPDGSFLTANPALAGIYGFASPRDLMVQLTNVHQLYLDPNRLTEFQRRMEQERIVREFESEIKCKDGSKKWISETACKVTKLDGSPLYYQGFVVDITAQKIAQQERNLMEVHLRQAQKLESVGQLAAGIAHEINTPIQYIGDNIRFVLESFADLTGLLAECQKFAAAIQSNTVTPAMLAAMESFSQKTDLAYLSKEIPSAAQQSLDGVAHVANIVRAMKEFSHPGSTQKVPIDLNHAIETTLTVARTEWKYIADVVTDFDSNLPPIPCLPGDINQVILNLVVNAAHAIGDAVKKTEGAKGAIKISTKLDGNWAEIRISDTGTGIPEEIRHRIFEPFFTTKEVGKGTGQGLAIARSTVVSKHGGQLYFESTMGRGTTFIVRLPTSPSSGAKSNGEAQGPGRVD
jgi:two-component system NtrC family sensor kinase